MRSRFNHMNALEISLDFCANSVFGPLAAILFTPR